MFGDRPLVIARDSALLGMWGLPLAVTRYRAGRATAEEVARALLNARILEPRDIRVSDDELPRLAKVVAAQAIGRTLPADSLRSLADALAREQEVRDGKVTRHVDTVVGKLDAASQLAVRGAEAFERWLEPVQAFLDTNPAVLAALQGRGVEPQARLVDRAPSLPNHDQRVHEKKRRADELARPDRGGAIPRPPTDARTLQEQLASPAESFRAFGQMVSALRNASIRLPDSVERVAAAAEPSELDARQAASDVVRLSRSAGDQAATEFLEAASEELLGSGKLAEDCTPEEFAERIAVLVAAKSPSRTETYIGGLLITLFFYLLPLIAPVGTSPEPFPPTPPIVAPAPTAKPPVDIRITIQPVPTTRPKDDRQPRRRGPGRDNRSSSDQESG
jgi:hypothetical protein